MTLSDGFDFLQLVRTKLVYIWEFWVVFYQQEFVDCGWKEVHHILYKWMDREVIIHPCRYIQMMVLLGWQL